MNFIAQPDNSCQPFDVFLIVAGHCVKGWAERIQAVQDGMETDVFLASQVQVQAGVLEDNADVAAHLP